MPRNRTKTQPRRTSIRPGDVIQRWDTRTQRWRLYIRGTHRLVPNRWNLPADGGGHRTEMQAAKQARAINHGLRQANNTPDRNRSRRTG